MLEDVNKPCVQAAAKEAVRQYNQQSPEEENYRFLIEVFGSIPWANCGFEHRIKLSMGKSTLLKKDLSLEQFEAVAPEDLVETSMADRKTIAAFSIYCTHQQDGTARSPNPCGVVSWTEDVTGMYNSTLPQIERYGQSKQFIERAWKG